MAVPTAALNPVVIGVLVAARVKFAPANNMPTHVNDKNRNLRLLAMSTSAKKGMFASLILLWFVKPLRLDVVDLL